MKILYLHQYFNTPDMSGGTRSYEMARRWVAAGHEVHMITSWQGDTDQSGWFQSEVEGIQVHWLPVPYSNHMSYGDRIKAFFDFAFSAGRKAKEIGGDVVFATSTPLTIAIPGVRAARSLKIPMVFEVRDLWPELPIAMGALKNPFLKWAAEKLETWAYRNSTHIVALSPGMKEGVVRTGYPEEKVSVIPNSADLEMFSLPKHSSTLLSDLVPDVKGRPTVVYTGTFGAINGVRYMVDMAVEAERLGKNYAFVAIGDGAERDMLNDVACKAGILGKNFWLLPPVKKRQVPELLAGADMALSLFINLEPMWANSANKFFDALASGTPVAINYGGWQADLIEEQQCGVCLPIDSPQEAVKMLTPLLEDADRLAKMGEAARSLAKREFSRDLLAEKMLAAVLSVKG